MSENSIKSFESIPIEFPAVGLLDMLCQVLIKGGAWEWTNMYLRLKVVVWCIVDVE